MSDRPARRPAVRDDLADLSPYGAPQLDVPVRLNTNETPWAPPPTYTAALADRIATGLDLHRYPDRDAVALRTALANREDLSPDRVWAANGSNEVLVQLFGAYAGAGRTLLLFQPGYSAHPLLARVTGTTVVTEDLDEDFRLTPEAARAAVAAHQPAIVIADEQVARSINSDIFRAIAFIHAKQGYRGETVIDGIVTGQRRCGGCLPGHRFNRYRPEQQVSQQRSQYSNGSFHRRLSLSVAAV